MTVECWTKFYKNQQFNYSNFLVQFDSCDNAAWWPSIRLYNWIWLNFMFDVKNRWNFLLRKFAELLSIFDLNSVYEIVRREIILQPFFLHCKKNCQAPDVITIYICHWFSSICRSSEKKSLIYFAKISFPEKKIIRICHLTLTRWMILWMATISISSNRKIQLAQRIRSFSSLNI